jgi:hypothetical protein
VLATGLGGQEKGLTFLTVDRVLYIFDKETNGSLAKGTTAYG